MDVSSRLEENTQHQLKENFKWYKRDLSKYHHDDWTVGEEINKPLLLNLKNYTMDTTQAVNAIYKGSEIIWTQDRAATEIFEQLNALSEGELSHDAARQILDEIIENAKRLVVFAWAQARHHDAEAKDYAIKALKSSVSLKHLETKDSDKWDVFSLEFTEQYNEANY